MLSRGTLPGIGPGLTLGLSDPVVTVLVLAAFAVPVGLGISWVVHAGKRAAVDRSARIKAAAERLGLWPSKETANGPLARPFPFFSEGADQHRSNVVSGDWEGLAVTTADLDFIYHGADKRADFQEWLFSVIAFELQGLDAPLVSIRRKSILVGKRSALDKLQVGIGRLNQFFQRTSEGRAKAPMVAFDSEEFTATFEVSSDDSGFAHRLIDGAMITWLLDKDGISGADVLGSSVLLSRSPIVSPDGIRRLLDLAVGFRDHVPRDLIRP